jgi:hypothetical protein
LALGIAFGSRPRNAEIESLAGIQLGEDRDSVVAHLGKPSVSIGDPWLTRSVLLGSLLRPQDVGTPADRERCELLTWNDDRLGVLLEQNVVRAVIARTPQSAETGRHLGIGDSERRLKQRYEEPSDIDKVHFEADEGGGRKRSAWGMIYRYAALGVSMEVRDERITGLALYPPK